MSQVYYCAYDALQAERDKAVEQVRLDEEDKKRYMASLQQAERALAEVRADDGWVGERVEYHLPNNNIGYHFQIPLPLHKHIADLTAREGRLRAALERRAKWLEEGRRYTDHTRICRGTLMEPCCCGLMDWLAAEPKEGAMGRELTQEEFIQQLVKAGWTREEAEKEYNDIQEDDESGYDGP